MKRRWRFWLAAVLLTLVAGPFLGVEVYWRAAGWHKGEALFQGRPTSYWKSRIRERYSKAAWQLSMHQPQAVIWSDRPAGWEDWLERLDVGYHARQSYPLPLQTGDEAELPVLLELLREEDPDCNATDGSVFMFVLTSLPSVS
jgi:hypothetical protein